MKKLLLASTLAVVLSQTLFAKEEVIAPEQSRFESLSKLTKVTLCLLKEVTKYCSNENRKDAKKTHKYSIQKVHLSILSKNWQLSAIIKI